MITFVFLPSTQSVTEGHSSPLFFLTAHKASSLDRVPTVFSSSASRPTFVASVITVSSSPSKFSSSQSTGSASPQCATATCRSSGL